MSFLLQLMFSSGWMFCLFVCAQSGTCWFVARYIGELEQVGVVGLTSVRLGWWFCESDVCPVCFFSKLVNLVDWLVGLSGCRNLRHIWKGFLWDSLGIASWSTTHSHQPPSANSRGILKSPKTCFHVNSCGVCFKMKMTLNFCGALLVPGEAVGCFALSSRSLSPQRRSFWRRMRVSK